ncbi:DUF4249 domain-containing protein [Taibaiella soli]|uniref:DUF4249 domain-containing protein n=1 Tax=Taibaiella soli TaxID=1649169 RepID=A0A2W2A6B4_9BACT|nr:DUF4249 domain-containing protein [Taibaiella soli]PZF70771.1 DUF4249 domain-containing protein [Taibaiella soli]
MKNIFSITTTLAICLLFTACRKVINVDLNDSSPKLVVEGEVSNDSASRMSVRLTRSVNFDQSNTMPTVSGAVVVVTDSTIGVSDTLREVSPGTYHSNPYVGIPGHTYKLYIKDGNSEYFASSTMPMPVTLDSVFVTNFDAFGKTIKQVTPVFTDPAGIKNYYRFVEYVDGKEINQIFTFEDKYTDGLVNNMPIFNDDTSVIAGDNLRLEMQCIDQPAYDFFRTFSESALGSSSTPGNPVNNISGGALGYFSAHTSTSRSLIVP